MKRTHKLRALSDAPEIVAFARSRAEAAAQLGVNRSTLHRWIKAGKVPEPGSARPKTAPAAADERPADGVSLKPAQSAEDWAAAMRDSRDLSQTELQLVDLARASLTLAFRSDDEKTRLSATSRFQALVRQLNAGTAAAGQPRPVAAVVAAARRRPSSDPRKILSAVK